MKSITIEKSKLLAIVRDNKSAHVEEYEEASKIYAEAFIDKAKGLLSQEGEPNKWKRHVDLPQSAPQNNSIDYDVVIEMLEMTEDESIILSYSDFRKYVRDEWDWQGVISNKFYSSSTVEAINGPH